MLLIQMLSHDACPQWTGVFLFSERWRNPAGYATIFIGEVIHMSEKTVTLHVRITESQKRHLQELAERKGLVLSKIIQNYIEKLLEKELSIPATPSAQARLSNLSFENSTFTLRCSKTLQQLYRAACSQEGLHANGISGCSCRILPTCLPIPIQARLIVPRADWYT